MKKLQFCLAALLAIILFSGCGGGSKRATLPTGVSGDIAVLALGADTSMLNPDQIALLNQTLNWMDRDMIQALKRTGLRPTRVNSEREFSGDGYLLKVAITHHKMIPKGARFLGGMMAGADVLTAQFDLIDRNGRNVLSWEDTQGSTKGGTYCAQTINRNAAQKIGDFLSNS